MKDAVEFASQILERNASDPHALQTVTLTDSDSGEISRIVYSASNNENACEAEELKKWIVYLLSRQLEDLPNDPLDGMVALAEFWNAFNFPKDSPYESPKNATVVSEYYSKRNYLRLVQKHRSWAEQQILRLRQAHACE
jgi:hypothetical protein